MNNVSRSTFSLYLISQNIQAYLTQDCIVLVTPLVLGLSSSCVTVHLQEDNVPWFQHYSTGTAIIISFLSMCFKYILPVRFVECFREMLLECNDEIINTHDVPFFVLWGNGGLLGTSDSTQTKDNAGCSP